MKENRFMIDGIAIKKNRAKKKERENRLNSSHSPLILFYNFRYFFSDCRVSMIFRINFTQSTNAFTIPLVQYLFSSLVKCIEKKDKKKRASSSINSSRYASRLFTILGANRKDMAGVKKRV